MREMVVGFTGTRKGMTDWQLAQLERCLAVGYNLRWAHHGDCVGADAEFHEIAKLHHLTITVHPPTVSKFRANKTGDFNVEPESYIKRNHAIVDASNVLIAAPASKKETKRSGTWATIRYARKTNVATVILYPK